MGGPYMRRPGGVVKATPRRPLSGGMARRDDDLRSPAAVPERGKAAGSPLFNLDAVVLHHLVPALEVALDEGAEITGAAALGREAEVLHALLDIGHLPHGC